MRWKWIVGTFALLIVIILIAGYVVLSSYDFNKFKPQIVKAVKDATGRELFLGGDIDLKIGLSPALTVEDVRFQNASWGSRPYLAKLKRFEVQVAIIPLISGNVKIKRLILIEPDILIETDKNGKSNLEFDVPEKAEAQVSKKEPADEETQLPALTFNKVKIIKGLLTYKDGITGKVQIIKLDNLKANTKGIRGSLEIEMKAHYNGEPLKLNGTLGSLTSLADPDKAWPMNVAVEIAGVSLNVDGSIIDPLKQKGINIGFKVKIEDLAKMEKLAGISLPVSGMFEASGVISDPAPKTYKVSDIKIKLGESDIKGSVELSLAGKRPMLKAVLSSQKLDLRQILVKEDEEAQKKLTKGVKKAKKDKVFSDEPLPLDAFTLADGSIKINITQLLLPQLAINDLNFDMILKNGHLTLKPLKASIGGGSMEGWFDLQPKGKSVTMVAVLKIDRVNLGNMLKDLDITDKLEGNLDVEVDLKSSGSSVAELMSKLNGNISIVMGKGRVFSKYINLLGADLRANVFRLINPVGEKENFTEINCLVSRFDIKDGLADSTALVFDSSLMSVAGEGNINLATEKLNLALKPLPKEGIGTKSIGKISLSLGELAKPFKLGGTLANPSLAIDPLQTAKIIGKAARGMAMFGPIGIATALVSVKAGGDENPCIAAIEAARTGVKAPKKKSVTEKATEGITDGVKGVGEGIMKLFGK